MSTTLVAPVYVALASYELVDWLSVSVLIVNTVVTFTSPSVNAAFGSTEPSNVNAPIFALFKVPSFFASLNKISVSPGS